MLEVDDLLAQPVDALGDGCVAAEDLTLDLLLVDRETAQSIDVTGDDDLVERYRTRLAEWQEEIGGFVSRRGGSYVSVPSDLDLADLLFDVPALVSAASHTMPLLPGDLLLTGSPSGNGTHWGRLLRDGDVMVGAIEGLGTQTVRCVAERSPSKT